MTQIEGSEGSKWQWQIWMFWVNFWRNTFMKHESLEMIWIVCCMVKIWAYFGYQTSKCSNSANFWATKMVFTKKLVRISPEIDWYSNQWPQDGKMWYVTAVLVKIHFFLIVPSAGPLCIVYWPFWGPLAGILDFTFGVVLQSVRCCRWWANAPGTARLVLFIHLQGI